MVMNTQQHYDRIRKANEKENTDDEKWMVQQCEVTSNNNNKNKPGYFRKKFQVKEIAKKNTEDH